jgi:RNA polymerase sigma-70 factor (ECF subfamily)
MMADPAALDATFRAARPRVLAALLRWFGDVEIAEEAFQEACLKALAAWPGQGPPRDPVAWLVLVGRNAGVDGLRRAARAGALPAELAPPLATETDMAAGLDDAEYGDDLLRLLFICCHRDLPATQQIALALRIVCGLSVAEIARAFLVGEAAMEQRITRAKRAIGRANVPFEPPSPLARGERVATVSAMIYLTFNQGHAAAAREGTPRHRLAEEAIRLARLLLGLFPDEPELMGLLALMLLHQARAEARLGPDGKLVLLEEQDRSRWNRAAIVEGTALTNRAFRMGRPGPYQLQAAIAALHARAPTAAKTDWPQIAQLYRVLAEMQPSPVVALNHAVAVSRAEGPQAALALVEPLATPLAGYVWFHAVRAHLLETLDRPNDARAAYEAALRLAHSAAEAAQIRGCLDRLAGAG